MKDEKRNSEHYTDLTPYKALRNIDVEERAKRLVYVLKYIIQLSGFDIVGRIHFEDRKTGKEFDYREK